MPVVRGGIDLFEGSLALAFSRAAWRDDFQNRPNAWGRNDPRAAGHVLAKALRRLREISRSATADRHGTEIQHWWSATGSTEDMLVLPQGKMRDTHRSDHKTMDAG